MRVQWGTENPRGRNESDFFSVGRERELKTLSFRHHEPVSLKRRLRGEHAC